MLYISVWKHTVHMWVITFSHLTICGSWMSVRLLIRAWLSRANSFNRLSLCCSIILFSSSIVFKLHSIDEICCKMGENEEKSLALKQHNAYNAQRLTGACICLPESEDASYLLLSLDWIHSVPWSHDPSVACRCCFQYLKLNMQTMNMSHYYTLFEVMHFSQCSRNAIV